MEANAEPTPVVPISDPDPYSTSSLKKLWREMSKEEQRETIRKREADRKKKRQERRIELAAERPDIFAKNKPRTLAQAEAGEYRTKCQWLANHKCVKCKGSGITPTGADCACMSRRVFTDVIQRYRLIADIVRQAPTLTITESGVLASRPGEEFMADVCLVAKRSLDDLEWRIFQMHVIGHMAWRGCVERIKGLSRGEFFHAVYRIQQKLGIAFRRVRPYPLFPLDEYFAQGPRITLADIRPKMTQEKDWVKGYGEATRVPLKLPTYPTFNAYSHNSEARAAA